MPKETEPQLSFSFDEPSEPEEPSNAFNFDTAEPEAPAQGGIFSGLSSSFLKDIAGDIDIKEEQQADKSGLIVDGPGFARDSVRAPAFTGEDADLAVRWSSVTSSLKEGNENIALILERTSLKKNGTSAYIVFEDTDLKLLSNLKKSQAFRQISAGIKDEFGAEHLYLCTSAQYIKQEMKNKVSEQDRKLDDLSEHSKSLGVPTDIHFGD